jgi:p-aminobenzoyl-glutamate transporter AbgT
MKSYEIVFFVCVVFIIGGVVYAMAKNWINRKK